MQTNEGSSEAESSGATSGDSASSNRKAPPTYSRKMMLLIHNIMIDGELSDERLKEVIGMILDGGAPPAALRKYDDPADSTKADVLS